MMSNFFQFFSIISTFYKTKQLRKNTDLVKCLLNYLRNSLEEIRNYIDFSMLQVSFNFRGT